ncbi:CRISPR-associated helicase/endonuclease Cas3 [Caviibacterium pharyngocola]|uniref:CRISPR-associated helicase/endonuclease Cas3 n=1 Tax=Caviibacterium pharyngocola TaxID=28159 RepID=A0A2M8RTH8_9PAST|nr:CRISPR-associated helicase/endonuclease Cas3 [Caviibacterium pharyngocola]PJG82198.1 CRISPR-associated helicase/endonuclease Cas3 [Caviibacterium pharyngocola]
MNESSYIAHVRQSDNEPQLLSTHLTQTAELARLFAAKLGLDLAGELLGLMHDFGKYSEDFQKYIREVTGFDPDADNDYELPNGKKIDHSTAGTQWIYQRLRKFGKSKQGDKIKDIGYGELIGQMLGLCIASHHGSGLIDCLDPDGNPVWAKRFEKEDCLTHLAECEHNADNEILQRAESLIDKALVEQMLQPITAILKFDTNSKTKEFYLGCLTRFLFSCLIDADRINSADFEHENQKDIRRLTQKPNWQTAIDKLETHLANFQIRYPIDEIRRKISEDCLTRSADSQGIYSLTVPTGGGKTLASLRYALHHAQKHNLDRIIYIIPYTSIIDQNAQDVRSILGEEWVLEHHSNLEPEKQNWQDKLLAENWDKPIVFTTMVQFLDAWFGSGTRGARHIHPMTNSVLIFDEIQTLPVKCVHLFCNVLNWLTKFGKSSAILCTATQPLLNQLKHPELGALQLPDNAEIMGDKPEVDRLFNKLSRVEIHTKHKAGGWSVDDAGAFLLEQYQLTSSCLFIVNTKKWAYDLYQYCKQQNIPSEALFHLSTNQCATHRKDIFDRIKLRLANNEPVICISTQLIEAGVNISMKCVIRALAGLDSIAQAAGRCNRHGEKEGKGQVYVLNLQEPSLANVLPDIDIAQQNADRTLREFAGRDILQPDAMNQYFKYYFHDRSNEMVYLLKNSKSINLLDWLSDNRLNPYSPKNNERKIPFPLLLQSFKSAGKVFSVIDAPTKAVIVPYGDKGKKLIADLCGEWNSQEMHRTLQAAQRYSVNVFPNVWEKLEKEKAIQEVQLGAGIYYLKERYYSDEYGLSLDETNPMTFYDL